MAGFVARRTFGGGARQRKAISGDTTIAKDLRCNEQIRISPIRLIDEENNQIGIVDVKESIARARGVGLDLVEVDPNSRPPVCRIMDYGKWKYSQRKKEQKSKSHRHETELKEIRIKTPKIGDHDLSIKVTHAREFLDRGDRVQFTLRFRGRELAHLDEGRRIFEHIKKDLSVIARIDQDFRYEGKRITMTLAPIGMAVPNKKPAFGAKKASSKLAGTAAPGAAPGPLAAARAAVQAASATAAPAAQPAPTPAAPAPQPAPTAAASSTAPNANNGQ